MLLTLLFRNQIYGESNSPFLMKASDLPKLMMVCGIGYMLIYFIFFLMYSHALKNSNELQLISMEVFDTKTKMYKNLILILIGIISVAVAFLVPPDQAGIAGIAYGLIGPALTIFYTRRKKIKRNLKI